MSQLPTPGGDDGTWGDILNDFLLQSHQSDGTLKPGIAQVSSANITDATATGKSLITVTSATSARTIIGAGTSNVALGTGAGKAADDSTVVHDTGTETIAGVKTFSSSPVVPTPTTDMQAATKKYVDDTAGSGGGSAPLVLGPSDTVPPGTAAGLIIRLGS